LHAERLYVVSEALADHCSGAARAFVYAVFSSGTLVVYVSMALRRHALRLAQLALLGSLLTNLLAVTGGALLAAGLRARSTKFSSREAGAHAALLVLATCGIFGVSTLAATETGAGASAGVLAASRGIAALLLLSYGAWLRFAHVTHVELLAELPAGARTASSSSSSSLRGGVPDASQLTLPAALLCALLIGAASAGVCGIVLDTLHAPATRLGISRSFLGGIAIPFAVNTGELAAALALAARGACTAAIGVSLRTATQIALCVLPSAVLGAALRGTSLDLNVRLFESAALLLSVVTVGLTLADGRADWLKGVALLSLYAVVAAGFLSHDSAGL
jgi:Ca2+:H+ antiporter